MKKIVETGKDFWKKNKKKVIIGGTLFTTVLLVALGIKHAEDCIEDGNVYEADTLEELPVFQTEETETTEEIEEVPETEE